MRRLTAQWVANAVGGTLAADVDAGITSVEKDSRDVTPGALYVAFVGERVDGHAFVPQALAAGATLCLVSEEVDGPHVRVDDVTVALGKLARAYLLLLRAEGDITVVGITGSNGKTTTKDLLAQMLPEAIAPIGSFNNEIGLPLTVLRADSSTRHLVLEMGASGAGHLTYLTSIAPLNIGVVLMVGSAHSEGYGGVDGVAAAKAELVRGIIPAGVAILNRDDARVAAMASLAQRVTWFSASGVQADVSARGISLRNGCAAFDLVVRGGDSEAIESQPVTLQIVGEHHVANALAAAAVALACGLTLSQCAALLSVARPLSKHRMALTERPDGVVVLDDSYNASPESMRAAFRALLALAQRARTFAVVGEMLEMGDAGPEAHAALGVDAVRLGIDHLVVVGSGAKAAFDSAVREGSWGDEAVFVATIDQAHEYLSARVERGDVVLIKASHGSGLWALADRFVGESA